MLMKRKRPVVSREERLRYLSWMIQEALRDSDRADRPDPRGLTPSAPRPQPSRPH